MKKWIIKKTDPLLSEKLAAECGLSPLCADVLVSRGITSGEDAAASFDPPKLSAPFLIKDMEKAADLLNAAVENSTPICIFGDYDCDGICSTVILYSYLECMDADVRYIIPERNDGYGLNEAAVRKMYEQGTKLIITVDNGISAHKEAELIYELGMKLIITDHHQQEGELPRAEAVVDPHRKDCTSSFKYLCGAGVVLKLIAAAEGGSYDAVFDEYGELAAIATVADIVSLTGENRYIVRRGLRLMENTTCKGLAALIEKSDIKFPVTSTAVAFNIAPRINAAGRVESPSLAARLLLTDSSEEALQLAEKLDTLNITRKNEENKIIDSIKNQLDQPNGKAVERVLVFSSENWHHGIIGIVASKMTERLDKPCFIITIEGDTARGSARSFGDFSIFDALEYCSDLLIKYGGHPGAGGFTVETSKIPELEKRLQEYASRSFKYMPIPEITADKLVTPHELTLDNVRGLSFLEPCGEGSGRPVFAMTNVEVRQLFPLSEGEHTKLQLFFSGKLFYAVFFGISPDKLFIRPGDKIDMMFTAEINTYKGNESVSIKCKDIRKSGLKQQEYFYAKDAYEKYRRNEQLPMAYYERICPDRADLEEVYKRAAAGCTDIDTLYLSLDGSINYCRIMVCADIFSELGLAENSTFSHEIKIIKGAAAKLDDSCILKSLREKCKKEASV